MFEVFFTYVYTTYNWYVFILHIPAVGEGRALSGLWREGSGGLHCSGLLPDAGGSRLAC